MKVKELMNPHVWSIRKDVPLTEALRLFWEEDVGCLPVVDEWNHVVGVVTDRDAAICAWLRGRPLAQLDVEECMSSHVYACAPDDEVEVAASSMRLHQVRRVPVIDGAGRLAGMLSINDIARAANEHPDQPTRRLLTGELARTLSAVAAPRRSLADEGALVELTPAPPRAPEKPAPAPRSKTKAR